MYELIWVPVDVDEAELLAFLVAMGALDRGDLSPAVTDEARKMAKGVRKVLSKTMRGMCAVMGRGDAARCGLTEWKLTSMIFGVRIGVQSRLDSMDKWGWDWYGDEVGHSSCGNSVFVRNEGFRFAAFRTTDDTCMQALRNRFQSAMRRLES